MPRSASRSRAPGDMETGEVRGCYRIYRGDLWIAWIYGDLLMLGGFIEISRHFTGIVVGIL